MRWRASLPLSLRRSFSTVEGGTKGADKARLVAVCEDDGVSAGARNGVCGVIGKGVAGSACV